MALAVARRGPAIQQRSVGRCAPRRRCVAVNAAPSRGSDLRRVSDSLAERERELQELKAEILATNHALKELRLDLQQQVSAARAELESRREQVAAAEAHLETLQATQVVWRGDANEVQLAGSFDGWTSKVPLEKREGTEDEFAVEMHLYPGEYEYKFIIDGKWTADENRETTNQNGALNNVLQVTAGYY